VPQRLRQDVHDDKHVNRPKGLSIGDCLGRDDVVDPVDHRVPAQGGANAIDDLIDHGQRYPLRLLLRVAIDDAELDGALNRGDLRYVITRAAEVHRRSARQTT
jgi:hypothetical protein